MKLRRMSIGTHGLRRITTSDNAPTICGRFGDGRKWPGTDLKRIRKSRRSSCELFTSVRSSLSDPKRTSRSYNRTFLYCVLGGSPMLFNKALY